MKPLIHSLCSPKNQKSEPNCAGGLENHVCRTSIYIRNPPKITSLDPSQDINPGGIIVDRIVRLLSYRSWGILGLEEHLVTEEVEYLIGLWIKRVGD